MTPQGKYINIEFNDESLANNCLISARSNCKSGSMLDEKCIKKLSDCLPKGHHNCINGESCYGIYKCDNNLMYWNKNLGKMPLCSSIFNKPSSTIEMFAQTYPKSPQTPPPTSNRTSIKDLHPTESIGVYSNNNTAKATSNIKKFIAVVLIVGIGSLVYSSIIYTLTDHLLGEYVDLFNSTGHPKSITILLHSVVFMILIYIVLLICKWH
jgi:hypothetical protein